MKRIAPVFLALVCLGGGPLGVLAAEEQPRPADTQGRKPNIVIVLADDMGWRDTGYNGNPIVKTPNLDAMAKTGVRFDYFYPGGQMCSPGRYALLTGRTPFRGGIHHLQAIRPQEIVLARALKQAGYRSAHFGKWHLGTNKTSPVGMGFDQAHWTPNFFDLDVRFRINDTQTFAETKGDSSVAVMNLALDYIRKQAKEPQPFFVYVCFGSPHSPHKAADEFKALYKDLPAGMAKKASADFWGEVSGLDAAVGNLRAELRKLDIADNTLVWFTSDNGGITPLSMDPSGKGKMTVGCRIPALLEWPARIAKPMQTTMPCGHIDIYPTLLDITGVKVEKQPVLDGISLVPLLDGKMTERPRPMGFMLWNPSDGKNNFAQADFLKDVQGVWIDGKYKLIVSPGEQPDKPATAPRLYDIFADPAHKTNLAGKNPEVVQRLREALDEWRKSVRASYDGKDFASP